MGAFDDEGDFDPFAEDEPPTLVLHPIAALHDLAECLEMIAYWRKRCESAECFEQRMAFLKRVDG